MDNDQNPIDRALGLRPMEEAKAELENNSDSGLPEIVEEASTPVIVPIDISKDETLNDIDKARSNIQNIISQGDQSLGDMMELAKQSESPRAYEVAANLMKTLLDANKDYVDMAMRKKYHKEELEGPKEAAQTNVTNNNLILSTTELLKMIKGMD
jgi:hypothetical protein